jgi:hypothetical protein
LGFDHGFKFRLAGLDVNLSFTMGLPLWQARASFQELLVFYRSLPDYKPEVEAEERVEEEWAKTE